MMSPTDTQDTQSCSTHGNESKEKSIRSDRPDIFAWLRRAYAPAGRQAEQLVFPNSGLELSHSPSRLLAPLLENPRQVAARESLAAVNPEKQPTTRE